MGEERRSRLVIYADNEREKKLDLGQTVEVFVECRVHRTDRQVSATTQ